MPVLEISKCNLLFARDSRAPPHPLSWLCECSVDSLEGCVIGVDPLWWRFAFLCLFGLHTHVCNKCSDVSVGVRYFGISDAWVRGVVRGPNPCVTEAPLCPRVLLNGVRLGCVLFLCRVMHVVGRAAVLAGSCVKIGWCTKVARGTYTLQLLLRSWPSPVTVPLVGWLISILCTALLVGSFACVPATVAPCGLAWMGVNERIKGWCMNGREKPCPGFGPATGLWLLTTFLWGNVVLTTQGYSLLL